MANKDYDHLFKILVCGASGVGKSSLLLKYCDDQFSESYISTIGVDFKIKQIEVNNKICKLQIWDTAGQERFATIVSSYFRGAHGIILVYDIHDQQSFGELKNWLDNINHYAPQNIPIMLVGNKSDLQRNVQIEDARNFAKSHGMEYCEISAKNGENLNNMFITFCEQLTKNTIYPPTPYKPPIDPSATISNFSCCHN